jgi:glucose/arabinose dehydrogenase
VSPTLPATTLPDSTVPQTTVPDPLPPADSLRGIGLGLEKVADLDEVTGLAWRAGDPGLYVSLQQGSVRRVVGGEVSLVLDISNETTIVEPGSERGLLGIAFDPRDGRMFVNFTGRDNHTRVVSYAVVNGVATLPSRRDVLFVQQPGVGHNGGRLVFDDAGHLYVGMGDGGGSNGRDAQDTTKLLGAILRVLPRLDSDGYDVPPDNPFADGVADRPEVWARGFRNPWMFSIDRPTGDMWIGDVGNDAIEEIDVVPAGRSGLNFGWYFFEGSTPRYRTVPDGMTPPVFEYPRSMGNAVMGGYVYRGTAIPALRGAYVFGDVSGKVYALGADGAVPLAVDDVGYLFGWGEDAAGELYLFGMSTGLFRLVPG